MIAVCLPCWTIAFSRSSMVGCLWKACLIIGGQRTSVRLSGSLAAEPRLSRPRENPFANVRFPIIMPCHAPRPVLAMGPFFLNTVLCVGFCTAAFLPVRVPKVDDYLAYFLLAGSVDWHACISLCGGSKQSLA